MQASGSNFSPITPPVFDGENYQAWAVKMTAYMEGCDMWEAVESDYAVDPLPENPTLNQLKFQKEKITRKAKAKSCLYATVSPTIFTRIMRLGSAFEIWNFLKGEYEGDERVRSMKVLNLMREFERQQMKDNESVKEYSDRLIDLANKIRILGSEMKDERLVQNALQAQEQRRLMRRDEPVESALQAKSKMYTERQKKTQFNQGKQQKSKGESLGGKEGNSDATNYNRRGKQGSWEPCQYCGRNNHPHYKCWRKPDMKCRFCHKMGHAEIICREKKSQQQQANTPQAAPTEVEQLFAISFFNSEVDSGSWLVDSGCTHHMTSDLSLFCDLDESFVSRVKIGNGEYITVKGRGNVIIKGPNVSKLISDVLYVPKVDQNLLCVGQLVQKGYKVIFENEECLIIDSTGEVLFNIPMKFKCFTFDPQEGSERALKVQYDEFGVWHRRLGHCHNK
ncbi:hypothetical protein K2173_026005 [Erythroxylum novogranatense]|uniref:Retrovirus-related Pol polyprotein from transposon TNT 1-94-like beta-barrel domain-containing protein n=1 Tax=Erythroxylum novogranatense TaxID=1862640 RepID=A0AAV8TZE4_9ROSI|nr:hypothetical protein K2173_026005 [Erythroxylum novogranatense]